MGLKEHHQRLGQQIQNRILNELTKNGGLRKIDIHRKTKVSHPANDKYLSPLSRSAIDKHLLILEKCGKVYREGNRYFASPLRPFRELNNQLHEKLDAAFDILVQNKMRKQLESPQQVTEINFSQLAREVIKELEDLIKKGSNIETKFGNLYQFPDTQWNDKPQKRPSPESFNKKHVKVQ